MNGTHFLCRDCGLVCETAEAPSTDAGDPCCPDCGNDWLVDPVIEIKILEMKIRVIRATIREVARETYRA